MMRARRLRPALSLITAVAMCAAAFAGGSAASAAPTPSPSSSPSGSGDPLNIVDKDATAETKSLFSYLNSTRGKQVLFGAQHTTDVGITFNSEGPDNTDSDVLTAVDDYPAIFGFDTFSLEGKVKPGIQGKTWQENVAPFAQDIQTAHRLGGIPTMAGHMMNFETGANSASDPTGRTVSQILPGGDKNAMFNEYLDAIAEVANTSTDEDDNLIPIIFRPFHENNGSWFWWGASNATTGEFKEIFRYTVEYLRDTRDVHNFLYSFSPNGFFAGDEATYLDTYPGNEWVDVLGYDAYESSDDAENSDEYISKVVTDLAMVAKAADHRGKISAFTEFGRNSDRTIQPTGNKSKQFFTDLLNAINRNPDARRTAYMLTWANWGNGQIYVPYAGFTDADGVEQPDHEMLPDFQDFYDDAYSGFAKDIPADALTQTGLTVTAAAPTVRVVSPADGVRIVEPTTTVRIKATVKKPESVSFTVTGTDAPQALTLGDDGYWTGEWSIGQENLTNATVTLTAVATYADGADRTATSSIILGEAPPLPNGVFDTFEGYGDDTALQGAYTFNNTTAVDLTLDPDAASEGKKGAKFAYNFDDRDYQGFGRAFTPTQDWSEFDRIGAHLTPDGSNQKLVLQFNAGGATFEAYPSLAGTDPLDLSIPFSEFKDKQGDRAAPTAEQLKSVTQFWVYLNKTDAYTEPGSIGLDNIRAMSETTPPGPTMIDVPTAPVWTDQCGVDNNGFFSGYRDTDQYAWKLIDRSTRTGKVRVTVRAKEGYAFRGVQRRLWTQKQDNSRCPVR